MQSIYKEILFINKPVNIIPIDFGYDDYDEYDAAENNGDDILRAIPLKRDMLIFGGEDDADSENIEDLESTVVNYPIKNIDEYDDSELYKEYPIAVSFTMDIHSYYNVINSGTAHNGALRIAHFGPHFDILFSEGVIVMASVHEGKADIIAGFKREGGAND